MRGLIQYLAPADTLQQGLFDSFHPLEKSAPWLDTISSGDQVEIYLRTYFSKNPKTKTKKSVSTATAGLKQTLFFNREEAEKIEFTNIIEDRSTYNPYSIYKALNYAADEGVVLTWYPDIDNYPDEYYSCIVDKIKPPVRVKKLYLWNFSFELVILPTVQMPSTVPAFV